MNSYIHGGAAAPRKTKRVFMAVGACASNAVARTGEAVCYDWDQVALYTEGDAVTSNEAALTAAGWNDARRTRVTVPEYGNNMHFAGVIDAASDGVIAPNWITIHEPGSVCHIRTGSIVSTGVANSNLANTGASFNFTIGTNSVSTTAPATNGRFAYTGLPGAGCACLLAEGAASVPNDAYLKMAYLQEGPPSGGVQTHSLVSTNLTNSTMINHGVIQTAPGATVAGAAFITAGSTTGTISVQNGYFTGQRLIVRNADATASIAVNVSFLTATIVITSLETKAGTGYGYFTIAALTASEDFIDLTWNGGTRAVGGSWSATGQFSAVT